MCNIAGYVGEKQAAPILIEMLKRQQYFDGAACAGIATLHNGKIYMRKVVGDVDTLINTTDALYLPGNIGIAHTRPSGTPSTYAFAQPFVTSNGNMAGMTNGNASKDNSYAKRAQDALEFLQDDGYTFRDTAFENQGSFPVLRDGSYVSCVDVRLGLVDRYARDMSVPCALAQMASDMHVDNVFSVLSKDTPDRFYVLRTTRPSVVASTKDGTYMASTRFAFDDDIAENAIDLPLLRTCEITKHGIIESNAEMNFKEVGKATPEAFQKGYEAVKKRLYKMSCAPFCFGDVSHIVRDEAREYFTGNYDLFEYANLAYNILYSLYKENSLKIELGAVDGVKRYLMWVYDNK